MTPSGFSHEMNKGWWGIWTKITKYFSALTISPNIEHKASIVFLINNLTGSQSGHEEEDGVISKK